MLDVLTKNRLNTEKCQLKAPKRWSLMEYQTIQWVKSAKMRNPKCLLIDLKFELSTMLVKWIMGIKYVTTTDMIGICGTL